jgi:DNA-binding PadR family transcriptional regulator
MRRHEKLHALREHLHGEGGGRRFAHGPHGPFGRGRGGRHFGRGGGLARLLEHGDLRLLVLHLIAEKPRHGYEIIKAIEELAGGAYAPSPGVVYPTLTLLEELGQVASTAEGSRKSYAITMAGTEALAAQQEPLRLILDRIAGAQSREPGLPVIRAMENLRNALRLKLGRGGLAPEVTRKIADTLDATARQIEEL